MGRKDWNARRGLLRDSLHLVDLEMCSPAFPQESSSCFKLLELEIVFCFCVFKMYSLQKRGGLRGLFSLPWSNQTTV